MASRLEPYFRVSPSSWYLTPTQHATHAVESLPHSRPLQQGVVDSEEEDQEQANDEPSEPEDDNEIDILADMLARQGNRRATADSDEEYEGW